MFEDREHVAVKVNEEGLGYFILDYTSADQMPDEELKNAFIKAEQALAEFENLLPEV